MTMRPAADDQSSQTAGQHPDEQRGDEIGSFTPDDEAALDRAWATITDEDIAASIRWLDEIKR